jgi:hypothetical protein
MTSRDRLNAVDRITRTLHNLYCAPGAKPDADWSSEHCRQDRRKATTVYDVLVAAGDINAPISISDDFLATS